MIFGKTFISTKIAQELIIASLFIIKAILKPSSATLRAECTPNISATFSMKKMHTILHKIQLI
jgi:hypothetical protein